MELHTWERILSKLADSTHTGFKTLSEYNIETEFTLQIVLWYSCVMKIRNLEDTIMNHLYGYCTDSL